MKIRTDFVTNSSSSSFISVIVETDNDSYEASYESGDNNIIVPDYLDISEKQFNSIQSGNDLLKIAKNWFDSTFADSHLPKNNDFSSGDVEVISNLPKDEINKVSISSNANDSECDHGVDISFDYKTGEYTKEYTGENAESIQELIDEVEENKEEIKERFKEKLLEIEDEEKIKEYLDNFCYEDIEEYADDQYSQLISEIESTDIEDIDEYFDELDSVFEDFFEE